MIFKPLFKLDAKGKVREWSIKVSHEKDKFYIETSNGLQEGKKIIHRREVERAKSKRYY